ncbi:hypothetical protein [Methylobacterium sp. AMS5]|uniref:hypothetical protein n=1 Tax=Methylobacterium sp. AMS5 TaxID=925818 RepID=UPI00074F9893|nr:hypothetical protein [Methylobacterium sp. AMS5]AMB46912.1 hypothetical protein Y590_18400 [Methylobacterium sp. AMS5]
MDYSGIRIRGVLPGRPKPEIAAKLAVRQCVERYLRDEGWDRMSAQANCRADTIAYQYGSRVAGRARFPLGPDADTSRASGMPPMIRQFALLCPAAAKRLKGED